MKSIPLLLLFLAGIASAEFETWTNHEGKSTQLDLLKVTLQDGEAVGQFKMKNGKEVSLKASQLSEADGKRLAEKADKPSVFDKALEGNLVRLEGDKLAPCTDATKPTKYYLFYYAASWHGPSQSFTSAMVEFYDKYKGLKGKEFELIYISLDENQENMTKFAVDKKMRWPQLDLTKSESFREQYNQFGSGMPNLVLTDLEGKILKSSTEDGSFVGPQPVLDFTKGLLE